MKKPALMNRRVFLKYTEQAAGGACLLGRLELHAARGPDSGPAARVSNRGLPAGFRYDVIAK